MTAQRDDSTDLIDRSWDSESDLCTFELKYLADVPDAIPMLASWHHRQWSYLAGARSLTQRIARLHDHLRRTGLPLTIVAWRSGEPIGSASLVGSDMQSRPDFSPWLASVFVAPEHRHHGVGAALVRRIEEEAHAQGFPNLYLYTEDRVPFYRHLGWQTVELRHYRGYLMTIMKRDLAEIQTIASSRKEI